VNAVKVGGSISTERGRRLRGSVMAAKPRPVNVVTIADRASAKIPVADTSRHLASVYTE
jgi:hypothetical protein